MTRKLLAMIMAGMVAIIQGVFLWRIFYGLLAGIWITPLPVSLWGFFLLFSIHITIYVAYKFPGKPRQIG